MAGLPAAVKGLVSRDQLGTYQILIKKYGILGDQCVTAGAADEFNPSEQLDAFGNPTTTATGVGRIDEFTTAVAVTDEVDFAFEQETFY